MGHLTYVIQISRWACVRLALGSVFSPKDLASKHLAPGIMDPRQPGLPQYDPRMVGEEGMSRGQLAGQYGLLPGQSFPMIARHLQPGNDYGIGIRELAMPPMGPPYLPGYNHLSTEQQLADLFSSQLELLGSPLDGPEESSGQQEGEDKPRSKMQEKNRRVSPDACSRHYPVPGMHVGTWPGASFYAGNCTYQVLLVAAGSAALQGAAEDQVHRTEHQS